MNPGRYGEFIKRVRIAQGLSVADLSKRSGITIPTIYRIEAGGSTTDYTLQALMNALDYDLRPVKRLP